MLMILLVLMKLLLKMWMLILVAESMKERIDGCMAAPLFHCVELWDLGEPQTWTICHIQSMNSCSNIIENIEIL